jgi:hypothetical protein
MQPVNGETNEVEAGRRLKPIRVPCASWTTSPMCSHRVESAASYVSSIRVPSGAVLTLSANAGRSGGVPTDGRGAEVRPAAPVRSAGVGDCEWPAFSAARRCGRLEGNDGTTHE